MKICKTLEKVVSAKTVQEFKHLCVKEEALTLISKIEELNEDDLVKEKREKDIISLYMEQLRGLPFLSAEEEKGLCIEIKRSEKEIEDVVTNWFDLIKNYLKLKVDLLMVKPSLNNKSINYFYSNNGNNGSYRPKGILLQLEKIDALKKELKRIKSVLNESREEIHNLDSWRETKEKGEAEISKLISQMKLDDREIKNVLHQLGMEAKKERMNAENWEQARKELGSILSTINKNLIWIRREKNKLIQSHLTLVTHIAKRYLNRGLDFSDLIQEGNQGLMRAVDTFDYRRGNRLISYAIWWIKQSIIRAIHNQSRTMRIPVYLFDRLNHYLNASEKLSKEKGRGPTVKELASEMKVSIDHIVEIAHVFKGTLPLGDYNQIQAERKWGSSNFEPILEGSIKSDLRRRIDSFLSDLSPREREVVELRFGINGKHYEHSLQEIGRKFNLSRERIRQIESSALIKLRKMRHVQELREFLN